MTLSGCGTGGYASSGSQGSGKKLFIQACGGYHTLADAGTSGSIGPNLDDAFAQAREAGMTSDTFTQVVSTQIKFPITDTSTGAPGMPRSTRRSPRVPTSTSRILRRRPGQAVQDIAKYVGGRRHRGHRRETDGRQNDLHHELRFVPHAGRRRYLGNVGPNLDAAKPTHDKVVTQVTNGGGAMPPFKGKLDDQQIQAVADYVSSVAGK